MSICKPSPEIHLWFGRPSQPRREMKVISKVENKVESYRMVLIRIGWKWGLP